jgi:hypothetical protein
MAGAVNEQATGERAVVERMAAAAADFLAALAPDQRGKVVYAFPDDAERRLWFYTPTDHGGLPLAEMEPLQQRAAQKLVATGLSFPGYVTASTIMGLENTLDAEERWRISFDFGTREKPPRGRDPNLYFVSIFGEPGAALWGWRFGGHHISLSYSIADGRIVAPTPTFFGAHPAEAPFAGAGILRPLGAVEDLARELLHTLDEGQRAAAVISPVAPVDLVVGNRPIVEDGVLPRPLWEIFRALPEGARLERSRTNQTRMEAHLGVTAEHMESLRHGAPRGLPAARMTPAQREILTALLHAYIDRMPEEIAQVEAARHTGDALGQIHFAWAGGAERRQPHYYRLQGARLLVEYDNTQDNVNHIHSVWRDPEGDFGGDLLARHYATAH